ncbi:menaquinone biosynthesis decarboxylase [Campylobacter sp. MIT 12-5580]|uniref:menaquinone biosynthesis decarboxylase n=1 Tax=Campylobacter sp. MIT 12-5580 TaxID=2040651 RepID=UPI0010F6B00A|nr:menaquinone biosynthesis decarboxylase [Campylobacter sp. MIT 12-5580]TKX29016.1 menaquinone biosynthesis decarboxylase [Campylobacter sp. MIT 12-5580]
MQKFIKILEENNLLKVISDPIDTELEMAHIAYIEAKKGEEGKALLFTNAINRKENKNYEFNVLMNTFCNKKALHLAFGKDYEEVASEIASLLKLHIPTNFGAKLDFFKTLFSLRNVPPKRAKSLQADFKFKTLKSLDELPILKTWSKDAGKFITMGQVYTQSLDGTQNNLGMYRLQVSAQNELLFHTQIHKDSTHFFNEYKKAGKKMPVSIAIGGDPLYIWCAQAPLPKGIFELLLYGFIKKHPAQLVKCESNELFVPKDSDIVIEGFVDTNEFKLEGPFGDHTGFYTPAELFPVIKVEKIFAKKNAVYQATVVGKPPLEDRVMGLGTERVFLPLLQTTTPDLIDYKMPENGVFHNLILAKIKPNYPAHAQQIMHAFWGVGQMSFVKHAVFVDEKAPSLEDYEALILHILNRFKAENLLISSGVCDQLDHASPNACFGGKLGLDATNDELSKDELEKLDDEALLELFKQVDENITALKQFFIQSKSPITCILVDKKTAHKELFEKLLKLKKHFKILIFLDTNNHLENPYMLLWRVVNNIDAQRDIFIKDECVGVDASAKGELEGYTRAWPEQTDCDKSVVDGLILRNIIKQDKTLFDQFELFE